MKSADLVRVMGGLLLLGMILFADLPTGLRLLGFLIGVVALVTGLARYCLINRLLRIKYGGSP